MSFIPLDETTIETANSYSSVAFADSYFSDRNNTTWASFATDEKKSFLILGSDYIDNIYGDSFAGTLVSETQSLKFPRYNYAGVEINYDRCKKATAELALRASTGSLLKDIDKETIREKIDIIEVEYKSNSNPKTQYPQVNSLLSPLLSTGYGGLNIKINRV